MIVLYQDAPDANPAEYDADALTCVEADAISRAIELPWAALGQALRNQDPAAMRGVVWAWRKRQEPTLRFSDFNPLVKELKARFSTEEIPDFLKTLDRANLTDDERTQALGEIVDMAVDPEAAQRVIDAAQALATQGPKGPEAEEEPLPTLVSGLSLS